jgi:hypothetical protein
MIVAVERFVEDRNIVTYAGTRLIHDLHDVLLQDRESEAVAFRHFRGLFESEPVPEVQTWFDFLDIEHRCQFPYAHGEIT